MFGHFRAGAVFGPYLYVFHPTFSEACARAGVRRCPMTDNSDGIGRSDELGLKNIDETDSRRSASPNLKEGNVERSTSFGIPHSPRFPSS